LDVKHCLVRPGRLVETWTRGGISVDTLGKLADVRQPAENDTIDCAEEDEEVTFLVVAYDGSTRAGETKAASESNYSQLFRVHENDVVVSHINAVNGAIGVVGTDAEGFVVSNEYTILRPNDGMGAGRTVGANRRPRHQFYRTFGDDWGYGKPIYL